MSDANLARLAYYKEATFGTPVSSVAYQILNKTSESLEKDTGVQKSQQVRSDRQVPYTSRLSMSAKGDLNCEFHLGGFTDFICAALLYSSDLSWGIAPTPVSASLTFNISGTINRSTGSFVSDGYVPGMWITIRNSANNNGYAKIAVVNSATQITVSMKTLVTEGPVAAKINGCSYIVNGTNLVSFTLERAYLDIASTFAQYTGMCVNNWKLGFSKPDDVLMTTFGFLGKNELSSATALGSSYVAASTNPALNTVDNFYKLMLHDGTTLTDQGTTAFNMELNNNLRARLQAASLGAISVGTGVCDVKGSFQGYFTDKTLIEKYLDFTTMGMAAQFESITPLNVFIIDLPAAKFTSAKRVCGGINTDIMADISYESQLGGVTGNTIGVHVGTHKASTV